MGGMSFCKRLPLQEMRAATAPFLQNLANNTDYLPLTCRMQCQCVCWQTNFTLATNTWQ